MSTTLTIRNLDPEVKQKLRLRAASHQRSMEAEARALLTAELANESRPERATDPSEKEEEMNRRINELQNIWKSQNHGKNTDEIMKELRGDD